MLLWSPEGALTSKSNHGNSATQQHRCPQRQAFYWLFSADWPFHISIHWNMFYSRLFGAYYATSLKSKYPFFWTAIWRENLTLKHPISFNMLKLHWEETHGSLSCYAWVGICEGNNHNFFKWRNFLFCYLSVSPWSVVKTSRGPELKVEAMIRVSSLRQRVEKCSHGGEPNDYQCQDQIVG